jgi:small subunit ribosomal protein S6
MYEVMTITKIELGEEKAKEVSKKIQELIASLSGKTTKTSFWGKRKLAYAVKHNTEGYYDVINFDLAADKVSTLKTKLSLMPEVLRYLITAVDAEK